MGTSRSKTKPREMSGEERVCVTHGPEAVRHREFLEVLRRGLEEAHGEVETLVFDGKTAGLAEVLDELRTLGLMGGYKLVVVEEADSFVTSHRKALERYAQSPCEGATLVLRAQRWHKGKLDQLIERVGRLVACDPASPMEAKRWIGERAQKVYGVKLSVQAAGVLVDRVGCDLGRLDSELGKLALLAQGGGGAVDVTLIEEMVEPSSDEQAWAIQNVVLAALSGQGGGRGGARAVAEKVQELIELSGQGDTQVHYWVADLFRKLWRGAVMKRQGAGMRQIIGELRIFGPGQRLFGDALNRVDEETARRVFDRLVESDVRSKTGLGSAQRSLECFAAGLADEG